MTRFPPKVIQLDLEDSQSIPSKAQRAHGIYGHIDVLINNAGISSRGNAVETDIKVDRRVMEVNFFGPVVLTKCEPAVSMCNHVYFHWLSL